jgi:multidrug transporter EmrE-like cation transporter
MSASVVGLVLAAALLHAGWNAIAKHISSQLAASTLIGGVYLVAGWVGVLILPGPAAVSWPFLAVSACLQTGYLILLTASYRHGDFSQLYPLARGLAVVQVTIVSAVVVGERLSVLQRVGVGVIAAEGMCCGDVRGYSPAGISGWVRSCMSPPWPRLTL